MAHHVVPHNRAYGDGKQTYQQINEIKTLLRREKNMSILRFVLDLESASDATQDDLDKMAQKIAAHAEAVVGVIHLAEKMGDDNQITYHVHKSSRSENCEFCYDNSRDRRG